MYQVQNYAGYHIHMEPGLRERKKAETRQRISDIATALFAVRGFDQVSVAEIAEAANVAKMTVFNYFPRKEDLMLDRYPELLDAVSDAVHGRRAGESPLSALRRMFLDLAERRHPLGGLRDGVQPWLRTVRDSPTLLAREREFRDELTATLADLIAEAEGCDSTAHKVRLTAALAIAAWGTVQTTTHNELLAGACADDIAEAHVTRLNQAFDAVEQALAGTT
jgi:AcrR family transcriptional regulator